MGRIREAPRPRRTLFQASMGETCMNPEADMYPEEWLPTRTMTEEEAEWFAEWLWQSAENDE